MDNQTNKLMMAKRKIDIMTDLPNILIRKAVVKTGDPILVGFTDFNVKLLRDEDRRFLFYAEWVDPEGEGHRIVLPHGVVLAIIRMYESLMKQAKRERALKGVEAARKKKEEKKGIHPGNQAILDKWSSESKKGEAD